MLNAKASVRQEFLAALKPSDKKTSTMPSLHYADTDCLRLLNISTAHLPGTSFVVDHTVSILSPSRRRVLDADSISKLELLYQQLYPDLNIISPFYLHAGRAILCGDILGSVMNATSCQSSSTIMAFWPLCHGNVSSIDYVRMCVGCIQYFCKHQLTISTADSETSHLPHLFAFVCWYERHTHHNWYGASATVCTNSFEPTSIFSFIPIQRIFAVGAHCQTEASFSGYNDDVFVSAPVPMKLSF